MFPSRGISDRVLGNAKTPAPQEGRQVRVSSRQEPAAAWRSMTASMATGASCRRFARSWTSLYGPFEPHQPGIVETRPLYFSGVGAARPSSGPHRAAGPFLSKETANSVWADRETVTCLRSVLMKPEHLDWIEEIYRVLTGHRRRAHGWLQNVRGAQRGHTQEADGWSSIQGGVLLVESSKDVSRRDSH